MRNLLMAAYYFPPSAAVGGFRLLGFARHLPGFGWRADVVAPTPVPWEPVDDGLRERIPTGTTVHWTPYPLGPAWKPLMRLAPYGVWLPRAWAACNRAIRARRPDALLTSGPPHCVHLLGLLLKRRHGIPWVADFRDPWAWVEGSQNPGAERWLGASLAARMEGPVMRGADAIILNAPLSRAALVAKYPEHGNPFEVITNGYDPDAVPATGPMTPPGGPLTIVHAGSVYGGRDPGPLLDAVRDHVSAQGPGGRPIRVRFLGETGDLGVEVRRRGLEGVVSVEGQVPHAEALREMARAAVLLLLDTPGRRVGVPAKLYEYVGLGRPILALTEPDGDQAWVLREAGIPHRIAPPRDPAAIRRALGELVVAVEAGGHDRPDDRGRGRLAFTREALAGRLAEVLNRCVGRPGAATDAGADAIPAGLIA